MINKNSLRLAAGNENYQLGKQIYEQKKVREFKAKRKNERKIVVTAMVEGNARNQFEVEMTFDTKIDELDDTNCTCTSFDYRAGMCKHCAAVAFAFIEYQEVQELRQKRGMSEETGDSDSEGRKTTESMSRYLLTVKKQLEGPGSETAVGDVKLEPRVSFRGSELFLKFQIGTGQMYVLKDILGLEEHMKKQEYYSYGKNLAFYHSEEAFEKGSLPIVRFLMKWASQNRCRYHRYSQYGGEVPYPELKEIPLSMAEAEEFFLLMGEEPVLLSLDDGAETPWKREEGKPDYHLTIEKKEGGAEVSVNGLKEFAGPHWTVTFQNGKIFFTKTENRSKIRGFLQCLREAPENRAFVGAEDMPLFIREILPYCETELGLEENPINPEEYGVIPVSFEFYVDSKGKNTVEIRAFALYGERKLTVFEEEKKDFRRDLTREREVSRLLGSICNDEDASERSWLISNREDLLYEFLGEGIQKLQREGDVFLSETMKKIRFVSNPKVSVRVSVGERVLDLKVRSEMLSREELEEILSSYTPEKKYIRLNSGAFVETKDSGFRILSELKQNVAQVMTAGDEIRIPKAQAFYLNEEAKNRCGFSLERDRDFKAIVRRMLFPEEYDFEVPSAVRATLREYQKTGYSWIRGLQEEGFGGILADDMGLGKTLQVITFLASCYEKKDEKEKKTVIVCPASLVYNWKDEFAKFAPELPLIPVIGPTAERKRILGSLPDQVILVTSYDLLRRDLTDYASLRFAYEIIDEAQYIKNRGTQVTRAVKTIQSGFRLAMTGTPIENSLGELWSIFDFVLPGFLKDYESFRLNYEIPITQQNDREAAEKLRKMVSAFILRRLKKDVLRDLPEKTEKILYAEMEEEQRKVYSAHVQRLQHQLETVSEADFAHSRLEILSELTKLRQICCDPGLINLTYRGGSAKKEACMELVERAVEGGHKILIFSQFTSMLEILTAELKARGIGYHLLTGEDSKEKRRAEVEAFRKDDCPVFCISLKAGGTGLNLTVADIVIHYDPWWNVAAQNQATDRVYRIGQNNPVNVYRIIAKDTVEDNIVRLQDKKKNLADLILNGDNTEETTHSTGWTKEEIQELLS